MIIRDMDLGKVVDYIRASSKATKVYIGCDSTVKTSKRVATYAVVVAIHIDGRKGCHVFGRIDKETDRGNTKMRMLMEAYKAADLAREIIPYLDGREIEIHLDINSDTRYESNAAMKEAAGYVLGLAGIKPKFKPEASVASHCADKMAADISYAA